MMIEALNSEGIKHYGECVFHSMCLSGMSFIQYVHVLCSGYVLDGIPSTSDSWKSLSDQLDTIKSLNLSPDVIINLKVHVHIYLDPRMRCIFIGLDH